MTTIRHINCGTLHAPPNPKAACHCLLLCDPAGLALVDAGIGLEDGRRPLERVGRQAIDAAGFLFDPADTAARRVADLGYRTTDVTDIVVTHGDPDHVGGLADFPHARVHVSSEEAANIQSANPRYSRPQFDHGVNWVPHARATREWFGFEAREVPLGFESEVLLIPLPGHTLGHCGVAVGRGEKWSLHVGDAYYLRVELATDDHPVSVLAAMWADDDALRRATLERLRRLARDHAGRVEMFGYHDFGEYPQNG